MGVLLGIDLGGTNTKLGLVGQQGILDRTSLPTRVPQGPDAWLERLGPAAKRLMEQAGIQAAELLGAGIDCPGTMDRTTGQVLFAANLPSFCGYYLRDAVSRALGVPAVLENDANTYAFGEYYFGAGGATRDLICLTLGTGVGGGIILNGQLVLGALGVGGELGHIMVEPEGRPCTCGARGCVECYASATGFRGMLAEALQQGAATSLKAGDDVEQMAQAALAGDGLAQKMFQRAGVALGRGVANLVVTTGIDLIVIGAGISDSFEPLMRPWFKKELALRLHMADPDRVHVVTSTLGNQAGAHGSGGLGRALHGPKLAVQRRRLTY